MGQKTNPIGNRLGFIKGWDSNWYGGKNYVDKLVEDDKIRTYLMARLRKASISKIIIERTLKLVHVDLGEDDLRILLGQSFDGRGYHLAGSAPFSEEIYNHRPPT